MKSRANPGPEPISTQGPSGGSSAFTRPYQRPYSSLSAAFPAQARRCSSKRARVCSRKGESDILELARGHGRHPQEQPAALPARDVGLAVDALAVAHRDLADLQAQTGGAEDQVEVAVGIEVAEDVAIGGD